MAHIPPITGVPDIYRFINNRGVGFKNGLAHSIPTHRDEGRSDNETRSNCECESQLLAARVNFFAEREWPVHALWTTRSVTNPWV